MLVVPLLGYGMKLQNGERTSRYTKGDVLLRGQEVGAPNSDYRAWQIEVGEVIYVGF